MCVYTCRELCEPWYVYIYIYYIYIYICTCRELRKLSVANLRPSAELRLKWFGKL